MNSPISISGFTIVRNAEILGYPFKESVRSILPICQEFIINVGHSDDRTLELVKELQSEYPAKIKVIESNWLEGVILEGGFPLKYQTDQAARACQGKWLFYLQADEVIHEADLPNIRAAIQRAESHASVDGILFEYIHFYGDYRWAIRGRNWYRREVRCFRNGWGIEAFRDAQGFRRNGARLRVIPAAARVFHYGYVRSSSDLQTKQTQMQRWWQPKTIRPGVKSQDYRLIRHIGLYPFMDTHPTVMARRVSESVVQFEPKGAPRKWDQREIKNALTLVWESLTGVRIGEFRNYDWA